jgi:hypothetical protein
MIVGLTAAALQGAPIVTQDVDLWFQTRDDSRILDALKVVKGVYVPPTVNNPPLFAGEGLETLDIVTTMHGLGGFDQEIENSVPICLGDFGVRVLRLDRIILSKQTTNRDKDRMVLPILKDVLKTVRARESNSGSASRNESV